MRLKPRATFGWMQGKRLNSTHRFGTTGTPLHEVRSIPFCGFREHLCTETNDFIGSTVHLLDQTYDHNSARMPGYLSNMKNLTCFKRCDPGSFWPLCRSKWGKNKSRRTHLPSRARTQYHTPRALPTSLHRHSDSP